jgi:hypothetical protein
MVDAEQVEKHIATIMNFRSMNGMEDMEELYIGRLPEFVRNQVLSALNIEPIGPGRAHVLSETVSEWYRPSWFPGTGNWARYRDVLVRKKMDEKLVIDVIDDTTTQILCQMPNPMQLDDFQSYGLVLGYVQSGKTANYSGLISKAVDAGYDTIIILAGLHNNLRLQTQHRLDRELTGVDHHHLPGVKVETPPPDGSWRSLTLDEDFNIQGNARHTISDRRPVYAVMKKNVVVMEKFLTWLQQAGDDVFPGKRLLMIDDEADHATVNTGSQGDEEITDTGNGQNFDEEPGDLDPSRTNECIRRILKLFPKRAYVGYTATPFANVLIDPFEESVELGPTLYPRNFIISLPKPTSYVGAEDMFPEDIEPSALEGQVRIIPDEQSDRIRSRKNPENLPSEYCEVEETLRDAILDYILTGCCRMERGHVDFHHSMLIHIHHMKDVQTWLCEKVERLWAVMKNYLRYSNQESDLLEDLESRWNGNFYLRNTDTSETWEEIKRHLTSFSKTVCVREINSSNPDGDLDYQNHPDGLRVIAIGGNKLSRGLTLEGLTVSYFGRPTQMYDSLLQMGRWFGFRPGYKDLVRLHLTGELLEWFSWLAHVERQIRIDIERYDRLNKSPLELAVRIQTHPQMAVTSKLKRRSAKEIRVGWDGQTTSTLYFDYENPQALSQNLVTGSEFIEKITDGSTKRMVGTHHLWDGVGGSEVIQFMNSLHYPDHPTFDRKSLSSYIKNRLKDGELDSWSVALISLADSRRSEVNLGGVQIRTVLRSRQAGTRKIPDLVDKKHWSIDLDGHPEKFDSPDVYYPKQAMLKHRGVDNGLLLLYVLDSKGSLPNDQTGRSPILPDDHQQNHILGLGIAFPLSEKAAHERGEYMVVKGVESDEN